MISEELLRRMLDEWDACECPYGGCPVYPHPAMREAAGACDWEPPPGTRPWEDYRTGKAR